MHRLVAALAVLAFLASGSVALAAGPSYVSAGGLGVLAPDGKTRYVALPTANKTVIARMSVHGGAVRTWADLDGSWGIPAPTSSASRDGLSRDGRTLIVGRFGTGSPSRFLVIDTRLMRSVDSITLNGDFAFDALSPDASTLYLIQHVDANNINRYVVRAYDLRTHTLRARPDRGQDAARLGDGRLGDHAHVERRTAAWSTRCTPAPAATRSSTRSTRSTARRTASAFRGTATRSPLFTARLALADHGRTLAVNLRRAAGRGSR